MRIIKLLPTILKNLFLIIFYKLKSFIQNSSRKKLTITAAVIILVIGGSWFLFKKYYHPKEDTRSVYEALVQVVDEKGDTDLKKGDVIAAFPEGHPWTDTEKTSYLIVKIKLEAEDAVKLTEAVTRETKNEAASAEASASQVETVQARKYTLDISVPTVNEIMLKGQPYKNKIFTSSIIEKK